MLFLYRIWTSRVLARLNCNTVVLVCLLGHFRSAGGGVEHPLGPVAHGPRPGVRHGDLRGEGRGVRARGAGGYPGLI